MPDAIEIVLPKRSKFEQEQDVKTNKENSQTIEEAYLGVDSVMQLISSPELMGIFMHLRFNRRQPRLYVGPQYRPKLETTISSRVLDPDVHIAQIYHRQNPKHPPKLAVGMRVGVNDAQFVIERVQRRYLMLAAVLRETVADIRNLVQLGQYIELSGYKMFIDQIKDNGRLRLKFMHNDERRYVCENKFPPFAEA